ncbi:hypothetical protein O0I10_011025 [Lichtheimia ornata]|uniref:Uncharacterized protein n=1 Tax=Lichtheimia ornata TaxID=688661 RepID=A0AAD7XQV4_9FUNG|nr:uncharacterized protein O0I10_011025 [Lichtheimia ornata]KAJ8653374.1 hypothetical protein O0I10_011025 [Lichtheimia ornata]
MRVLKTSSHCLFWVNMLDDGTSGSNRIRISKQECETAARQHGWHGDTVSICDKNAIEQHHKVRGSLWDWLDSSELTKHHAVANPLSAILLLSRLHVKDVIVLYFPVELYMLCPGTVRLLLRPHGFKIASSVRTAPSFYGY